LGETVGRLQQESRFANAGIAADQHEGTGNDATA
jgi:hypothetical protein